MSEPISVTLNDFKEARRRIRRFVNLSPCNESPQPSAQSDCKLHLKMENLQRTGAYKDRGAMNAVLGLNDAHRRQHRRDIPFDHTAAGLAKDGRLAKISVIVPDRPASIVDSAAIAGSQQANILDIHHGRTFTSAAFRETEIELMVETRGPAAVEALLWTMAKKGYQAQPFKFE
jgi:hypothetical protein